jgi:hypothetical protein
VSILGIAQFFPMILLFVLNAIPMFFVLPKAGFSRWWLLMIVVPVFGLVILLSIMAFSKWSKRDMSEVFS